MPHEAKPRYRAIHYPKGWFVLDTQEHRAEGPKPSREVAEEHARKANAHVQALAMKGQR